MKIEHIALWTNQLEAQKNFYETYFAAQAGDKYTHAEIGFESYFLTFPSGGPRLELMSMPDITPAPPAARLLGLVHIAFSAGSKEEVDRLTARLDKDGFRVASQPRTTGVGYYESIILDPDGNQVEITL